MIEIPAAALAADEVLAQVDFASIGTNDLAQYTFAADRGIAGLAALQSPWHPALLRLVEMAARAGEETGRPVGVCGEAAARPCARRGAGRARHLVAVDGGRIDRPRAVAGRPRHARRVPAPGPPGAAAGSAQAARDAVGAALAH